jgi:hypothetical protein
MKPNFNQDGENSSTISCTTDKRREQRQPKRLIATWTNREENDIEDPKSWYERTGHPQLSATFGDTSWIHIFGPQTTMITSKSTCSRTLLVRSRLIETFKIGLFGGKVWLPLRWISRIQMSLRARSLGPCIFCQSITARMSSGLQVADD